MSELAYVKLSEIRLWEDNPRTFSENKEREEIVNMLREQRTKTGNKLVVLASSITENIIYEPIGVLRYSDGFMIVKEGNRRITCLKLLKNPNIIPHEFSKVKKAFEKLKKSTNPELFDKIPARIFNEDENEDLERWIELRHNGLQGGKGLDSWRSMHKENWNKYRGQNTPLLDFQNYLVSQKILTKDQIDSVSKTNWNRILGKKGQSHLGIKHIDGRYKIIIELEDFKNRINQTVENLSGQSVSIVYDNQAIDEFFSQLDFKKRKEQGCNSTSKASIKFEDIETTDSPNSEPQMIDLLTKKPPKVDSSRSESKVGVSSSIAYTESTSSNEKFQKKEIINYGDKGDKLKTTDDQEEEKFNSDKDDVKAGKTVRRSTKPSPFLKNIICDLKSSQETDGIIRLVYELKKMSSTKHYNEYPIGAAMLMRNLLEQCLIYYLKKRNKWRKFYKTKKHEPTLTEIIAKYNGDTDIFQQDDTLRRLFKVLGETPGLKEYFNLIVHHPHKVTAKPDCLDVIAKSGYLALIQHIIDFKSSN